VWCRRIVYCQDEDGTIKFKNDPSFKYLVFPIGKWRKHIQIRTAEKVGEFFKPLFDFLDAELAAGECVLIHCLTGAHLVETAGIASLVSAAPLSEPGPVG